MATLPTSEELQAKYKAGGNRPLTMEQIIGAPVVPTTINSSILTSSPSPSFINPEPAMPGAFPPIEKSVIPESAYAPTVKEGEISSLIKDITTSSGIEGERLAFTAEQEKVQQLEGLQKAEMDYASQLRQLEADYKNIEPRTQEDVLNRGITTKAGLAPITASEQRKLLMQANTVSALYAAAQGRVSFAQQQVDRAVNLKFAQREADRKAKIENLNLLLQDPTLTLQQQKRADARKATLDKEAETDVKKKEDSQTIMKWGIELASNPLAAQQIMNIATSENPDLAKAFEIYSQNKPQEKSKLDTQVVEVAGRKQLIDTQTGRVVRDLGVSDIPTNEGGETRTIKFTTTQLNKGASNAGIEVGNFSNLDPDVQNFYVNMSPTQATALRETLVNISSGTQDVQEAIDYVKGKGLSPTAENYLIDLINTSAPEPQEGFWSKLWGGITELFK